MKSKKRFIHSFLLTIFFYDQPSMTINSNFSAVLGLTTTHSIPPFRNYSQLKEKIIKITKIYH